MRGGRSLTVRNSHMQCLSKQGVEKLCGFCLLHISGCYLNVVVKIGIDYDLSIDHISAASGPQCLKRWTLHALVKYEY